jgi:HPt (histidine-containing phosphotransfer) domain-containing protein
MFLKKGEHVSKPAILKESSLTSIFSPQVQQNLATIQALPALNHATLDSMRQEMRSRGIDWLLDLYLRELPNYMKEMTAALHANDGEQLYLAAHKFKGGSANLGADQVVNLCKLFEHLSKQNDLETANRLLPVLEMMTQQLQQEISDERQSQT